MPVFLPGESHGQRSLVDYSAWGYKESEMTEATEHTCREYINIGNNGAQAQMRILVNKLQLPIWNVFSTCFLLPCSVELVTSFCSEARGGDPVLIWSEFLLCGEESQCSCPILLLYLCWDIFYLALVLLLLILFLAHALLQSFL